MAKVRLVSLKKIYEKNVVGVEDINLEIEDKEFCVLVGPSGCGKSTTLRLIAGLESPTEGEIYIGDRKVNHIPLVFLFDEPLSNLDAKLRVEMRTELKKLHKRLSATTIYVTHDQIEAMTMGDKIVILNKGRIQQIGDTETLYDHPVNYFVAGFMGSPPMNFIEGAVEDGIFRAKDGDIKIPIENVKGKVIVGVRSEDIVVDSKGNIKAGVELVEALGNEALLHLSVGDISLIMRMYESPPHSGDVININFKREKLHIFNAETGERL
ncbi:MAG: ATP-binding cassette domain-containing protein [bacterium]|nr:ATP-binding cassette domain-containing protein [bacterium]